MFPSARILLFSTLFAVSNALPWSGVEPTASYKPADYTARPTSVPQSSPELLKRDFFAASTCGWIAGSGYSPVVCESGSSCVWDSVHSVVGCCPEGESCDTSIYTSCVDANSPSQTASEPGIKTCGGGNFCYRNTYPGGYYQLGCGASSNAAFVETTFSGMGPGTVLNIVQSSITFGAVAPNPPSLSSTFILLASVPSSITSAISSPLPTPSSTLSTSSPSLSSSSSISSTSSISITSSSSESSSSSSTSLASSSTSSISHSSSTTSTVSPAAATSKGAPIATMEKKTKTGIIAGSVIGATGAILAVSALACFYLRRRVRRQQEDFIRSNQEEKEKYFGNDTSITSSIRGSSEQNISYVIPNRTRDLENIRTGNIEHGDAIIGGVVTATQRGSNREIQSARTNVISPLSPPQNLDTTLPSLKFTASFEAHPGQPWPLAPASPPTDARSPLFSQSNDQSQQIGGSSGPEPRRITLTDRPYHSPVDSSPTLSTLEPYTRPPTPPPRSPKRLTLAGSHRGALLGSPLLHQPQEQVSKVELSPRLGANGNKQNNAQSYPSYDYTSYSALKEEESGSASSSPPISSLKRSTNANTDATVVAEMDIHPTLRIYRGPGSNASALSVISRFSESSRYSRSTSGDHEGRSLTGTSISESTLNNSNRRSSVARKALPTDSAVAAYGSLRNQGHMAALLKKHDSVSYSEVEINAENGRPLNEQWRPTSKDSNYVAPLRVVSRSDNGAGAGVPLLGMPSRREGRRIYDV